MIEGLERVCDGHPIQECGDSCYALALEAEVLRLRESVNEARAFAEDAAAKHNALLAEQRILRCAFCGHAYPEGTPASHDDRLAAHIKVCPKHPMRELELAHAAQRSRVADAVERLRGRFKLRADCNTIGDAVEDACAQLDGIESVAMSRPEAQAVLERCSHGHQACHQCPALGCCDNLYRVKL